MYGIFTYIYHKNQRNVGKYTIHGSYGYIYHHQGCTLKHVSFVSIRIFARHQDSDSVPSVARIRFNKLITKAEIKQNATVDGRNPASVDMVRFPIICRVSYIPGGAGFLPSTVQQISANHHGILPKRSNIW